MNALLKRTLLLISIFLQPVVAAAPVTLPGIVTDAPEEWIPVVPESSMRAAQYRIPGVSDSAEAQVVIYFFGPGQGGTAEDNIARWRSQFSTPEGAPVEPVVEHFTVEDIAITQAEFRGYYARGVGVGPVGKAKPDQTLIAAVVEGPQGKLFVQLFGPSIEVDLQRAAYGRFLNSMRAAQ